MNRIQPPNIRFSGGYRTVQGKAPDEMKAQVFVAGYENQAPTVEVIRPGESKASKVPMHQEKGYWVSKDLPLGTAYRTTLPGHSAATLDWVETVERDGDTFNVISTLKGPRKPTVIADIFQDSVLTIKQLAKIAGMQNAEKASQPEQIAYIRAHADKLPMRNHFNAFGGNQAGIIELMPDLKKMGITSLLIKPGNSGAPTVMGKEEENTTGSHYYWNEDPYTLNSSFEGKAGFEEFLDEALKHGMKLFNDGAYVNQGLSGIQFLANMVYGKQSPYWDWFITEQTGQTGRQKLPRVAYEGMTLGVLPTKLTKDGHRVLDYAHIDFDVINDPEKAGYKKYKPTYIKVFNAAAPNGTILDPQKEPGYKIANSEDSIHTRLMPVEPKTLKKMRKAIGQNLPKSPSDKQKFLQIGNNRLGSAAQDDSTIKWNGQIDVAKINIHNPDVVKYVGGSFEYWTRFVSNYYTGKVAKALSDERPPHGTASIAQLIDNIPDTVLPRISDKDKAAEQLSNAEIQAAIKNISNCDKEDVAKNMASGLLKEFPLMALELPKLFKATLSYPGLSDRLAGQTTGWRKMFDFPRRILSSLPLIGIYFQPFEKTLAKKMSQVMDKLDELEKLSPASEKGKSAKEKLRSERVRSLVYEQLGRDLLMEVFTDITPKAFEQDKKPSRAQIEDALYKNVPGAITKAPPQTAARLLPSFMKHRLKGINPEQIAKRLNAQLAGLDPELAEVAAAVLNKREFGLNWRLDAAKDVGDIGRILETRKSERPKLFQEEMAFARSIWKDWMDGVRNIFPNSTIIAELTDFDSLAGDPKVAQQEMSKFFNEGIVTSTPDMRYFYNKTGVSHYVQRPDEFGQSRISPSAFLEEAVRDSAQAYPAPANRQKQMMGASHDFMTVSHAFLLNTDLWTMDHLKWWGLNDDLKEACNELKKPCFAPQMQNLRKIIPNLDSVLNALLEKEEEEGKANEKAQALRRNFFHTPKNGLEAYRNFYNQSTKEATRDSMLQVLHRNERAVEAMLKTIEPQTLGMTPEQVKQFLQAVHENDPNKAHFDLSDVLGNLQSRVKDEGARSKLPRQIIAAVESVPASPNNVPTPHELKAPFVDAFLDEQAARILSLNSQQMNALKTALKPRMAEASEAKGMRAVIVNTLAKPAFWDSIIQSKGLNQAQVEQIQNSLWNALDAAIAQWGRHFGYQPLDVAIDNVFKQLDKAWAKGLPAKIQQDPDSFKQLLKTKLYMNAMMPVKEKLLRYATMQTSIPGSPSVYLPDAFMQTGGEWLKNLTVQDRNLIRVDRLKYDQELQGLQAKLGEIYGRRAEFSALNNGHPQKMTADDNEGIIPFVMDNGQEQVITLFNTGSPGKLEWAPKVGSDELYPQIESTKSTVLDYKADVSDLHMAPGTVYHDKTEDKDFVVNEQGQLVDAIDQTKGMNIHISRVLVRDPSRKISLQA